MDNFTHRLGVFLLTTVLLLGAFFVTLSVFEEADASKEVVMGVSTHVNGSAVALNDVTNDVSIQLTQEWKESTDNSSSDSESVDEESNITTKDGEDPDNNNDEDKATSNDDEEEKEEEKKNDDNQKSSRLSSMWTFDEERGQTAKDTGEGKVDGVLGSTLEEDSNDPTWVDDDLCIRGGCLMFDGIDDYVDLGLDNYIHNNPGSFTLLMWAKGEGYQDTYRHSRGGLFGWMGYLYERGIAFGPNDINDVNFWVPIDSNSLATLRANNTNNSNEWTHWVAVYNAEKQTMKIFKNSREVGRLDKDNGVPASIYTGNTVSVKIGDRGDGLVNFSGYIDEVKYYNNAMSAGEIKKEYQKYKSIGEPEQPKVFSPAKGDRWATGSKQTIKWKIRSENTASLLPSPLGDADILPSRTFTITLAPYFECLDAIVPCVIAQVSPYVIADEVPDTRFYVWDIPEEISSVYLGENMRITVRVNNSLISGSSQTFTLAKATSDDDEEVTDPKLACDKIEDSILRPRGDKHFENLHLDVSQHPEIIRYKIQWFNGKWSRWFTKGIDDEDWKTNTDGTHRRVWSYFADHNHRVEVCMDGIDDSEEEKGREELDGGDYSDLGNSAQDDLEEEFASQFSKDELKEIDSLRARIRRLQRKVSQLEKQVIEKEKQFTKEISQALTQRLRGKILLQVEEDGEAWYVDDTSKERFYLKDGDTAYEALQAFGLGISNADLEAIPIGVEDRAERIDSDGDGLDDKLEEAIGTDPNNADSDEDGFSDGDEIKSDNNPHGKGKKSFKQDLAERLEGKILLQVEEGGEAWYIHNGRRYYMKNGQLAYQIMRFLSLGITNDDLRQIAVGELE